MTIRYSFEDAMNVFIDLQKTYDNLETALYGHSEGEGKTQDNLCYIEEYILKNYLGSKSDNYVVMEAALNYVNSCIYNNKIFRLNELNEEVTKALDYIAQESIFN